jgi:hypothetical protein
MKETSLALLIILFASLAAYGQSVVRASRFNSVNIPIAQPAKSAPDENALAARGIAAVKRLEKDVVVYRSLGEFEASGRLARVSFEVFQNDLREVTGEVEPMLSRLPPGRLKTEISNALDSYRDGAFWWQKIHQSRVVSVSTLYLEELNRTPTDPALLSTVPYTVAIHWRQAGRYLKQAERLMDGTRK